MCNYMHYVENKQYLYLLFAAGTETAVSIDISDIFFPYDKEILIFYCTGGFLL